MALLTKSRDKEFIADNPIEIDAAVEKLRLLLAELPWISHPFHIAQRFYKKVDEPEGSKVYYFPEIYIPDENETNYSYHELKPDNGYTGMFFFMAGIEKNNYSPNEFNYLTTPVSIIFSVNLELIDKEKLIKKLFTQELISEARRLLTNGGLGWDFQYKLKTVTRDLKECYKEFILDDLKQYNRAPLQCFRFELDVTVKEQCSF